MVIVYLLLKIINLYGKNMKLAYQLFINIVILIKNLIKYQKSN